MTKSRILIPAIMVVYFSEIACAQEPSYLCIPDLSTGFVLQNGQWSVANFDVTNEKYIVLPETDVGKAFYKIGTIGSATATFYHCKKDTPDVILCGGLASGFIVNTRELRFQRYYGVGFVHGDLEGNTPLLEIGRCSPI